jgi:hypothetical protein
MTATVFRNERKRECPSAEDAPQPLKVWVPDATLNRHAIFARTAWGDAVTGCLRDGLPGGALFRTHNYASMHRASEPAFHERPGRGMLGPEMCTSKNNKGGIYGD